jgi:hypothetical protein
MKHVTYTLRNSFNFCPLSERIIKVVMPGTALFLSSGESTPGKMVRHSSGLLCTRILALL